MLICQVRKYNKTQKAAPKSGLNVVKKEKIKVKSKVLPHIGTQIKGKTQSNVNHAQKAATKSDLMQENKCIVVSQILKSLSHP